MHCDGRHASSTGRPPAHCCNPWRAGGLIHQFQTGTATLLGSVRHRHLTHSTWKPLFQHRQHRCPHSIQRCRARGGALRRLQRVGTGSSGRRLLRSDSALSANRSSEHRPTNSPRPLLVAALRSGFRTPPRPSLHSRAPLCHFPPGERSACGSRALPLCATACRTRRCSPARTT